MTLAEVLATGNLEGALAEVAARLRASPENVGDHVLFFELLVLSGAWDRAKGRLDVLERLGSSNGAAFQYWRAALAAEEQRRAVCAGAAAPSLVGEPEPWMLGLVGAFEQERAGRLVEAAAARAHALAAAPPAAGHVGIGEGEVACTALRDVDDRFGPVLEMLWMGRYYWLPLRRVRRLRAPRTGKVRLIDLAWFPVSVTLTDGTDVDALVPTRYPGSEADANPLVRVGTKTELSESELGVRGRGQRLLASAEGEWPLLELGALVLTWPS